MRARRLTDYHWAQFAAIDKALLAWLADHPTEPLKEDLL